MEGALVRSPIRFSGERLSGSLPSDFSLRSSKGRVGGRKGSERLEVVGMQGLTSGAM